jgi:hypothetical protein
MSDKINFLPEDYMDRKAQHRTNIICLGLFCMVMAGVAGGFVVTEKRQAVIEEQARRVNNDMLQASESLKQLEVLEEKKHLMMQKASTSAALMESVPRSLLLATVTNNLPPGVSLVEYQLIRKDETVRATKAGGSRNKKAAAAATSGGGTDKKDNPKDKEKDKGKDKEPEVTIPPAVTSFEITGVATSDLQVATMIAALNQCPLFQQVNLMYSEEYELKDKEGNAVEETLRKFKVMVVLNPASRASETDVEMARKSHVTGM